jgi:MFS family permease
MALGFYMRRIAGKGDETPENAAGAGRERGAGEPAESLERERAPRKSSKPSLVRALRHRNYRLFFGGQLISLTGTWMQMVAQSWLVYRLTGSAILLGAVGFSGQIPVFLLAPLGGSVADRFHRRRILVATQTTAMLLAFFLAALTLTGYVQVWHVFVLASLLGIANAFDIPTRQAFVVDMVGKEDLINAIALNSSMINGARIVGPALAGVLLDALGEGWCFLANGVSYLAVIAGLLLMRMTIQTRVPLPGSALASIIEGFRYVKHARPIRALLLLLGLVSLMGMPYAVLMPIFADQILHGGARELGLLLGATGLGALAGSVTLAAKSGIHGLGRWVALAATGFGVSLVLFSLSRFFWLSAALLLPVGFCMIIEMASSNTLIQSMAVYSMMFMGMVPFGSLLAGALAHSLGAPSTVALGGFACIVGALVFAWRLPALRLETRRVILALEVAGGEPPEEIAGEASAVVSRSSEKHGQ